MATRTIVTTLDDLDGSEATETVRFGLDGTDYEIDLNDSHAHELRETLSRYASAGRKLSKSGRALHLVKVPAQHDLSAVRAWARSQGLDVADKGRISSSVLAMYDNREKNGPVRSTERAQKPEPVPVDTKPEFIAPTATSEAATAVPAKNAIQRKRATRKAGATKAS
jgi:hypothetical protein